MSDTSKREFLKALIAGTATTFIGSKTYAISILEDLKTQQPSPLEKDLIQSPKKQIMLAEKMACWSPGYNGYGSKMKCHSYD